MYVYIYIIFVIICVYNNLIYYSIALWPAGVLIQISCVEKAIAMGQAGSRLQ